MIAGQMGSYFSDKIDAIAAIPTLITQAPVLFLIVFAIGGTLIWLKYWLIDRSVKRSVENTTHGHRTAADRKTVRHDTGVGTAEVLVMRPAAQGGALWFALIFFGGGAVFYFLIVLQSSDRTTEDWLVFATLAAFAICAMIVIEMGFTRIYIDEEKLVRRRILHRRQIIRFVDIASVTPAGKSYAGGVKIQARSGDTMRILASFSGYLDLLTRLGERDQKLRLFANILSKQKAR